MKIVSITAIALFLIGFAGAAEESTTQPAAATSQAEQEGAPIGTPIQTSGKIVSMHSCPMVGGTDPHMVVKLQTEQGDTDIVDLGSASELKSNGIDPKEGQQLWVDGRVGKINEKFLIVAERLSEAKLVTIARPAALTEETIKHAAARNDGKEVIETKAISDTNATRDVRATSDVKAVNDGKDSKIAKTETVDKNQQARTVEGTVIHTRHIRIEGEADEHVLAKIKTASGTAVIDLGTCPAMPNNVNLTDGQSIVATGFVGELNGKPIILADTVGNMSSIQRNEATPASTTPTAPGK